MRWDFVFCLLIATLLSRAAAFADGVLRFSGERKRNNLVAELLDVESIAKPGGAFSFDRSAAGWVFVSASCKGAGKLSVVLGEAADATTLVAREVKDGDVVEAVRHVAAGKHSLRVECDAELVIDKLVVKAIPELIHCGLGFDPAIKSYGRYDLEFLKKDILPNITTLIVPHNIQLAPEVIDDWHGQGKRFVAEVGINGQATTADEHVAYWTGFLDKAPFLNGFIINEFIINAPSTRPLSELSPERKERLEKERGKHRVYEEAFRKLHVNQRYQNKMVYAYIGGSGKTLNQEVVGPTFVRSLTDCNYRIALERYLFERSSEQKSKEALDEFIHGIADWNAKEPGVNRNLVLAFGLFSMPPGGINKLPNVDYHVWMDQQMNIVANNPGFANITGLEWWTTILADEETTRFVGKLYRHYAIEGNTELFTRDPLFTTHLQNADFEKGIEGWTLHAAEDGSIQPKSFPRYGRIEGRFMGLGRPADPEHIGDTFLLMRRSEKGPNTFSQTIKDLEPGRLYSLKMFSCDYHDLANPKQKTQEEASKFVGKVTLDGVEIDTQRSFVEAYPSSPEPPIPVWITYHWFVFRAKDTTAQLTVSDWPDENATGPFGLEQTFNFLELQPYHE